jgi:hypothetical protein
VTWFVSRYIDLCVKNFKVMGAVSFEICEHFLCISREDEGEEVAQVSDKHDVSMYRPSNMYRPSKIMVSDTAV